MAVAERFEPLAALAGINRTRIKAYQNETDKSIYFYVKYMIQRGALISVCTLLMQQCTALIILQII